MEHWPEIAEPVMVVALSGWVDAGGAGAGAMAALVELYNLDLDLRSLDERSQAYLRRVEAGLAARPDVKEVVDQIDERQETPTGDLVSEIEDFLRSQSGDDD